MASLVIVSHRFIAAGRRLFVGASNPTLQTTPLSPRVSYSAVASVQTYITGSIFIAVSTVTFAWMAFLGWLLLWLWSII
jgi:hypothetical protein